MTDGFVVPRTVYRLEFTDEQYAGMVVRVRKMSMDEATHAAFDLAWEPGDDMVTRKNKQLKLHQMFIDHLVEWNLRDEDKTPVPMTVEGLRSCETDFVGMLVGTWQVGRRSIPAPLERNSSGGDAPSPMEEALVNIPSESLVS